jgi:hypothetical protein
MSSGNRGRGELKVARIHERRVYGLVLSWSEICFYTGIFGDRDEMIEFCI